MIEDTLEVFYGTIVVGGGKKGRNGPLSFSLQGKPRCFLIEKDELFLTSIPNDLISLEFPRNGRTSRSLEQADVRKLRYLHFHDRVRRG